MATNGKKTLILGYGDESIAALEACRTYLEQAIKFLSGKRKNLPDVLAVTETSFPNSSILSARHDNEDKSGSGWPFVACVIADDTAPGKRRSERYFDQWYFVVMRLLELPGGRFRFDRSKKNQYFYLAYAGPQGKEGNHYLRRIIANTPWWSDTRENRREAGSHYDYRRAALKRTAKNVVRRLGQETRSFSRERDDAVSFAVALFKRQLKNRRALPGLKLTAKEYERLLVLALEIADALHEKLLLERAKRL